MLSATVIVIGLLLGTASIATGYAARTLADTDGFVTTFAPLAQSPEVQAVVADAVIGAVEQSVDIPELTAQVFDGIRSLGISDQAASALTMLEGPTVQGLKALVAGVVRDVVSSPAFAEVWEQTLRVSHTQVVATLRGDADAALAIGDGGALELQLGPIVDAVKARMLADGITVANAIPEVDRRIVLVENAAIGQAATAYALLVGVAAWLPWAALALIAAGVLTARDRRRTLLVTAAAAVVLMAVLGIALAVGRAIVIGRMVGLPGPVTPGAGGVVYDAVTAAVGATTSWIAVIAIVVVVGAWVAGPGRAPRMLRERTRTTIGGILPGNR